VATFASFLGSRFSCLPGTWGSLRREGFLCPHRELNCLPNVTQFFSTQLRKDLTPLTSLNVSPGELTAGTPELDVLLTVHLQVCKALLQVAGVGHRACWGQAGDSESSLQEACLLVFFISIGI
jgi:hypothetical protein